MEFNRVAERLGGPGRLATMFTVILNFLHSLFAVINYCHWMRNQRERLGAPIVDAYLSMVIIGTIFFLFVASVFYMWAWRFPEPEEVAKRRRIYGTFVNMVFADIPLFVVEVKVVWMVRFADGIQGFTFCLSCVSLAYSILRVWTFFVVKVIKIRAPVLREHPRFTMNTNLPVYPRSAAQPRQSRNYRDSGNRGEGDPSTNDFSPTWDSLMDDPPYVGPAVAYNTTPREVYSPRDLTERGSDDGIPMRSNMPGYYVSDSVWR